MADIIFPGELPIDTIGQSRLPSNVDLAIWKGDAFEVIIQVTDSLGNPVPLTGMTPEAMIREDFSSPTVYSFTCTVQNSNEVRIYMPSATSKTIPAGDYVWNFQLVDTNSDVRTYLAGDVKVYAEVDV